MCISILQRSAPQRLRLHNLFHIRDAVDDLRRERRIDALGQIPILLGELRAMENGEGGFQPDPVSGFWIIEQIADSFQRSGGKVAQLVIHRVDVFAESVLNSGFEIRLTLEPNIDGGPVDAGVESSGADGPSLGKGGGNLDLNG